MGSTQNDLIAGLKSNNRQSLEKIYTMHYRDVERYIVKNSGTESDAKDVFQEALIAAWLNIKEDKFVPKTEDSLGGYIFQIAKYKWLDKLKSKAHKQTIRLVREDTADAPYDFDDIELQKVRAHYLKKLYENLDQKCRAILDRFYYQKMNLEEIGSELSYDTGTIKTLKYRCMKKLRAVHLSNSNHN